MFLRGDHGFEQAGGTNARSFGRALVVRKATLGDRLRERFPDFDPVPDLGSRIGSGEWFRGVATCAALCGAVVLLSPGFERPIYASVPAALTGTDADIARAQAIAPMAAGSATGTKLAATSLVANLTDTPERPILQSTVTLGSGGALQAALTRSGVGKADAARAADLVAGAVALGDLKSGTQLDLTLGRRVDKAQPRPLEKLAFRARFDLSLELVRSGGGLALNEIPIAIDHTPLRIRGRVGESLYRSARAAGAPAKAVEAYIRSIATRVPIGRVGADSEFDIIVEQARAATGEVQMGNLLYAGLNGGAGKLQLVRWEEDGRTTWYDGRGTGERKGQMAMPAAGRISSGFGLRRHPVLGFSRMHKGLDIAAGYGSPIRAANDGTVAFAGRNGGYGNFVRLNHSGGMGSGYGHMSRIAVRSGQRVARGQVIGYVGSTGISTGPHLHYELYRNGVAINPRSVSFSVVQALSGGDLREFKAKLARLLAVPVGGTRGNKPGTDNAGAR
ncbi:M23 family peptidase [Sphingomonas koreensis]|uniref:M23 family metallopeptidase n=1 Tax=Sphingomonas koreensis TaxID=93064 RepID=UPI0008307391|nr:M23 family metallopeptidase [Sphingomonas koreensis]PJI88643.1 peptidase M23-like protein [Sphingomonas koreensis]RSU58785.1 M23 family peptidase [Sphingomonas koreensis]RSU67150.1 M23 family peptidase [Sphingomonas koreensis]